jgi:hypothetical protein
MAPIRPGNSYAFWAAAAGIELGAKPSMGNGANAFLVDRDWAAYVVQNLHGSDIYRVPMSEVTPDFDAALAELERRAQLDYDDNDFVQAYQSWPDRYPKKIQTPEPTQKKTRVNTDEDDESDDLVQQHPWEPALPKTVEQRIVSLVEHFRVEVGRRRYERNPTFYSFRASMELEFWQRWYRTDWYWSTLLFEWLFLTGMVYFLIQPWMRQSAPSRWALRVAMFPFLFMLPVYLGYAVLTFTTAGPSGGVLYPFLLIYCSGGSVTQSDIWLLRHVPQLLEPLSTPSGSAVVLSGRGMPGPTSTIVVGAICGLVFYGCLRFMRSRLSARDSRDGAITLERS